MLELILTLVKHEQNGVRTLKQLGGASFREEDVATTHVYDMVCRQLDMMLKSTQPGMPVGINITERYMNSLDPADIESVMQTEDHITITLKRRK